MSTRKSRKQSKGKIIISVIGVLIFIFLLFIVKEKNKYSNIFFKETFINGVDCSLQTIEEAKSAIQNNSKEQYSLDILFKDNSVETISGTEIDFTIKNLEKELEDIKNQQRKTLFFKGKTYTLENFTYNKKKLKKLLLSKNQLQKDYYEKNSKVKYIFNPNSKLFELEQNIFYLEFNDAFKFISKAIKEHKTQVSLESLYLVDDTTPTLEKMNALISTEITYQLPNGKTYVLDANTLHMWLLKDNDGNYFKDMTVWNDNIEDFVTDKLSSLANNVNSPKEFKPTGLNNTVLVEGGDYGYQIDSVAEIQKLKKDLENNAVVTRKPCYQKAPISNENYGFGNSYVEIDLTRQKVWVYVHGNLKIETDCVTGCINKGHTTPTGIFTLTYKQENKVLRGRMLSNGKYEYESPVSYWMPFNGGIGLHDATWRSSFGGNIYISNGSHGCVNLPLGAARDLYNIIDYNMPIVVYKS